MKTKTSSLRILFHHTCQPAAARTRIVDSVVVNTTLDEAAVVALAYFCQALISTYICWGLEYTSAGFAGYDEDPAIFSDIVLDSVEDAQ